MVGAGLRASAVERAAARSRSTDRAPKKPAQPDRRAAAAAARGPGRPPDQAQAQVEPDRQAAQTSHPQADDPNTATDPRLQTLRDDLKKSDGVHSVTQPLVNDKGTAAVMTVHADDRARRTRRPSDARARRCATTTSRRRQGRGHEADVGGTTAGYVDLADEISARLVLTIVVVVALSFLLLMLAFRSIVIPLDRGHHEPDLDRRGVRRGDRGVREGLGRVSSSGSTARSRSSATSR